MSAFRPKIQPIRVTSRKKRKLERKVINEYGIQARTARIAAQQRAEEMTPEQRERHIAELRSNVKSASAFGPGRATNTRASEPDAP